MACGWVPRQLIRQPVRGAPEIETVPQLLRQDGSGHNLCRYRLHGGARSHSQVIPPWARLPGREAWPWWFVTDLRGLHPRALVESPSSFRRRGVFITNGALDRA